MLRCREITELVSQSLEHELPWRKRVELRMHLLMCRLCHGFARSVKLLRRAVREHPDRLQPDEESGVGLSEEARRRIIASLRQK